MYLTFILLPYYIAYSIIEPRSFWGMVGVFIFGSVIVPLSIWAIGLIVAAIGLSFETLAEKKAKNTTLKMRTINQTTVNTKSKMTMVLAFLLTISIGFIIYLLNNRSPNFETLNADTTTVSQAVEAADEVTQTSELSYSDESNNLEFNQGLLYESNRFGEDENIETQNISSEIPNLKTLGPSHLSLNLWFKDSQGLSFYMEFQNAKRPELDSIGFCQNIQSELIDTDRYSNLIQKKLRIRALFECDNDKTLEVSTFIEDEESHLIITMSSTGNPNRVFYSGEMTQP
ncbi:hypothetical protein CDG61_16735 [Acinetobacter sp. WCHAc010052]|nr:hypothetical protein CDG61_16735 [Acinetobacter sp. WCHAc010052]